MISSLSSLWFTTRPLSLFPMERGLKNRILWQNKFQSYSREAVILSFFFFGQKCHSIIGIQELSWKTKDNVDCFLSGLFSTLVDCKCCSQGYSLESLLSGAPLSQKKLTVPSKHIMSVKPMTVKLSFHIQRGVRAKLSSRTIIIFSTSLSNKNVIVKPSLRHRSLLCCTVPHTSKRLMSDCGPHNSIFLRSDQY